MFDKKMTADVMVEQGIKPETPSAHLSRLLRMKIMNLRKEGLDNETLLQSLYPNTILDYNALESLTVNLVAGNNILFFGPPGSGKTNLAKDVWDMFPKEIFAVEGCPVQDNPHSVFNPDFSKLVPPCPFCKSKYGGLSYEEVGDYDPSLVDPKGVPVRRMILREGHGFARIQGSPEVFPDNLTGTINLQRLEQIGDPTSPLVLEPGKLLQANRGLLLVDEVGKLLRGTQNLLLQALQEHIVSPAKSRETFPASFIAVCTSNLDDLDNINEPLNDRLSNIYVGFNKEYWKNRKILDIALGKRSRSVFIPEVFLKSSILLTDAWRTASGEIYELSEVGSNRTMIDIITRAEAYAGVNNRRMVGLKDFEKGALNAMLGRIRARGGDSYSHNKDRIESFVSKHLNPKLREAGRQYWCMFYKEVLKEDKPEGKRVLEECQRILKKPELAKGALREDSSFKKYRKFGKYMTKQEHYTSDMNDEEIAFAVFSILASLNIFECEEGDFKLEIK